MLDSTRCRVSWPRWKPILLVIWIRTRFPVALVRLFEAVNCWPCWKPMIMFRFTLSMIVFKYVQFERTFDMNDWRFETFTAGYMDFWPIYWRKADARGEGQCSCHSTSACIYILVLSNAGLLAADDERVGVRRLGRLIFGKMVHSFWKIMLHCLSPSTRSPQSAPNWFLINVKTLLVFQSQLKSFGKDFVSDCQFQWLGCSWALHPGSIG